MSHLLLLAEQLAIIMADAYFPPEENEKDRLKNERDWSFTRRQ